MQWNLRFLSLFVHESIAIDTHEHCSSNNGNRCDLINAERTKRMRENISFCSNKAMNTSAWMKMLCSNGRILKRRSCKRQRPRRANRTTKTTIDTQNIILHKWIVIVNVGAIRKWVQEQTKEERNEKISLLMHSNKLKTKQCVTNCILFHCTSFRFFVWPLSVAVAQWRCCRCNLLLIQLRKTETIEYCADSIAKRRWKSFAIRRRRSHRYLCATVNLC